MEVQLNSKENESSLIKNQEGVPLGKLLRRVPQDSCKEKQSQKSNSSIGRVDSQDIANESFIPKFVLKTRSIFSAYDQAQPYVSSHFTNRQLIVLKQLLKQKNRNKKFIKKNQLKDKRLRSIMHQKQYNVFQTDFEIISQCQDLAIQNQGLAKVIEEVDSRIAFTEKANLFLKGLMKTKVTLIGQIINKIQNLKSDLAERQFLQFTVPASFQKILDIIEERQSWATKQSQICLYIKQLQKANLQIQRENVQAAQLLAQFKLNKQIIDQKINGVAEEVKIYEDKCLKQAYYLYVLRQQFWLLKKVQTREYVYRGSTAGNRLFKTCLYTTVQKNIFVDVVFFLMSHITSDIEKILKKHSSFNPELTKIYPFEILSKCLTLANRSEYEISQINPSQTNLINEILISIPINYIWVVTQAILSIKKDFQRLKGYKIIENNIQLYTDEGIISIFINPTETKKRKQLIIRVEG